MALPTLRMIAFILGIFLITLAGSMIIPIVTQLTMSGAEERLSDFVWPALITLSCGLAMVLPGHPRHVQLRPRDMYMLTTSSWVVV